MKKLLLIAIAALAAASAFAQTSSVRWELRVKGSAAPLGIYTTQTACDTAARSLNVTAVYECPRLLAVTSSAPPVVCPAAPAPTVATIACPAGTTGSWQQTTTVTVGAPPACSLTTAVAPTAAPAGACVTTSPPTGSWTRIAAEGGSFTVAANTTVRFGAGTAFVQRTVSGAGQCTTSFFGSDPAREIVKACDAMPGGTTTPPADPPTTPPGAAVTYHFSDCQTGAAPTCVPGSNANPGTQTAPKQNLAGINVNTLPGGSSLLFNRSGSWNWTTTLRLDNRNSSAALPLTFDQYGTGPAALIRVSARFFVETGENENTALDGGYVFRGFKFEGLDTAPSDAKAFFLRGALQDVVFEDNEFTGFFIALYSQGGGNNNAQRITARNNRFLRNKSMGVLGSFNNSLFEGNLFEANNLTGSGFEHGTYFSNLANLTLRNNRYIRNSVINGVCQGGNMTFHGQIDGLVIDGNRIEQDQAAPGCWLMSITQGYATAEWFRNVVVRNNKLINGGNNAMNLQSAPGALVEGNVIINTNPTNQIAISVGHTDYPNGDVPDGNAVVRNNTVCLSGGATGGNVLTSRSPGTVATGNIVVTGAAATTGVCAR